MLIVWPGGRGGATVLWAWLNIAEPRVGDLLNRGRLNLKVLDHFLDGDPQEHVCVAPVLLALNRFVARDTHLCINPGMGGRTAGQRHDGATVRGKVDAQYQSVLRDGLKDRVVSGIVCHVMK